MYSNYWMGRHVPRKKTVAFLYIGLKSWFSGFCRININSYFRRGRYWYCWRPILAFFLSLYSIYYVLFSYFGYSFPAPILALFWLLSFCSPSPIIPNLFFLYFFAYLFVEILLHCGGNLAKTQTVLGVHRAIHPKGEVSHGTRQDPAGHRSP